MEKKRIEKLIEKVNELWCRFAHRGAINYNFATMSYDCPECLRRVEVK